MERGETEVHRMTAALQPPREYGSNGLRIEWGGGGACLSVHGFRVPCLDMLDQHLE